MLYMLLNKNDNTPKDWAFMKQSEEVLDNLPETWLQYPDNEQGRISIIDMEYLEFKQAKTKEEKEHELVHLASACLHLWRQLRYAK